MKFEVEKIPKFFYQLIRQNIFQKNALFQLFMERIILRWTWLLQPLKRQIYGAPGCGVLFQAGIHGPLEIRGLSIIPSPGLTHGWTSSGI